MTAVKVSRRKTTASLRQRQKAGTVKLILDALGRCLQNATLGELNVALIAREAGIGERTLYRYFPTRHALFGAFWDAHMESIQGPHPSDAPSLLSAPLRIFPEFDEHAEITRSLVSSPQGLGLAQGANKQRQRCLKRAVREAVGGLPAAKFIRLCATVQTLLSPTTWLQMRDFWGLDGRESGQAVSEAIEVLLSAARRTAAVRAKGTKS
jgi:AcrR family transcriptional regulator